MRERFDATYPSHGPFPVGADIIDALISGTERIRKREIKGADSAFDTPAKAYDAGAAKFLYI